MAMSLPLLFGGGVITGAIKLGVLSAASVAMGEVNGVFGTFQSSWLGYMRFLSVIMRIRELRKNIIEKTLDRDQEEHRKWQVRGRRAVDVK
jgi:ABC-type long-subunit fatty acid transport system fused permease/ATPase subunit